jgi:hypothetical protein
MSNAVGCVLADVELLLLLSQDEADVCNQLLLTL